MSNILRNNFWRLRPCLEEKLASLDEDKIEQIVILVPRDQGFAGYLDQYLRSLRLKTHVVKSIKWPYILSRKYYCLVKEGLTLPTCDPARKLVITKTRIIEEKDGFAIDVAINNTRIMDWGIYQSPRVVVHGVEKSFLDHDINDHHDHDKEAWTTFIKDASYAILDHWDRLKERLQKQYRIFCYYFLYVFGVCSFFVHLSVLLYVVILLACKGFSFLLLVRKKQFFKGGKYLL